MKTRRMIAVLLMLVMLMSAMGTAVFAAESESPVTLQVAQGEAEGYATIKEAWTAAMAAFKSSAGSVNSCVITLQEDYKVTGSTTLSTSGVGRFPVNVTLDLNGHDVYGAENVAEVFNVYSAHSALLNFEVKNGVIRDNTSKTNGVFYVRSNNTNPAVNFTVSGVTFTGNSNTSTTYGGVISALSSAGNNTGSNVNVKLVGCTFMNNETKGGGGAVRASNLTVTGCTFEGNHADGKGGAIFAFNTSTFTSLTVDETTAFKDNTAGVSGNDISFQRSGSVTAANQAKWVSVAGSWYNDDAAHRDTEEAFDVAADFAATDKTFDVRSAVTLPTLTAEGGTYEYDSTLHIPTVTLSDGAEETYTVQYSADGETWSEEPIGATHVDEGEVTVYVRAVSKENPALVVTAEPVTVSVYPHAVTITSDDQTLPYTGTAVGTKAAVSQLPFYEACESSIVTSTCTGKTEVGEYADHFTFAVDWEAAKAYGIQEHDYTVILVAGKLTVADAGQSVTMEDWTCGEKASTPVVTNPVAPFAESYGEPTFTYYDSEGKALEGVPTNAGKYTVVATWKSVDGSLPDLTAEGNFTVREVPGVEVTVNGEKTTVKQGTTTGDLKAPTKSGYTFGGWTVNGKAVDDTYVLQSGDVVEPVWKEIPKTGDDANIALWAALMTGSLICLGVVAILSKKYAI